MLLSKLSCGIIYTDAFQGYLEEFHAHHSEDHPGKIITFEYIRAATGPHHGKAWWQLIWTPFHVAPSFRIHRIGHVDVLIPKHVQHGLRERCLDYREGQVLVLP